jgi:hypothetical protein
MSTFRARLIYTLRVATRFIFRGLAKKAISLGRADRITQHLPPRQPLHRKTEREESSPVPATGGGGAAAATFQPVLSMARWLEVTPNTTQDRNEGESHEVRCPAGGAGGLRIIEEIAREIFWREASVNGLIRISRTSALVEHEEQLKDFVSAL